MGLHFCMLNSRRVLVWLAPNVIGATKQISKQVLLASRFDLYLDMTVWFIVCDQQAKVAKHDGEGGGAVRDTRSIHLTHTKYSSRTLNSSHFDLKVAVHWPRSPNMTAKRDRQGGGKGRDARSIYWTHIQYSSRLAIQVTLIWKVVYWPRSPNMTAKRNGNVMIVNGLGLTSW